MINIRQFIYSFLIIISLSIVAGASAHAASTSNFQVGRIIDDSIFTNSNSMTVDEIQKFLEGKMPNCDTNGTQLAGGGTLSITNAQWIQQHYNISPPYRCLTTYRQNPETGADNYGTNTDPSGSMSAAQIIYNYSKQFNINPQVIIVTLQKENSIVTDNIPIPKQYREAMGFGCPDHVPAGQPACDPAYNSFSNQIYQAARHFRGYLDHPAGWWVPFDVGTYNITWSPHCSRAPGSVYIQNRATAALYSYTPYQPSAAALAAGYGRAPNGDDYGCAAYGNRNFYLYFTDWFGPTTINGYSWNVVSADIYDENKHVVMGTDHLHKNERLFVSLKVRNTSGVTWYKDGNNPTRLGSSNPQDHPSKYCDVLWPSCNRAASLVESSVPSGEIGTFEFYIHAPAEGGEFREYFRPVLEYMGWGMDAGWHIYVNSTDTYDWQWQYFDAWTDSTKTQRVSMDNLEKGQSVYIELKIKNTSATDWTNSGPSPVNLGTQNPQDSNSPLYTPSWITSNRLATIQESVVHPGDTATFAFTIKAPQSLGVYRQFIAPVMEYKGWMRYDSNHIYLNVTH